MRKNNILLKTLLLIGGLLGSYSSQAKSTETSNSLLFYDFAKHAKSTSRTVIKADGVQFVRLKNDEIKSNYIKIEVPAEQLSFHDIVISVKYRAANLKTQPDNKLAAAKVWLMLEKADGSKQFLAAVFSEQSTFTIKQSSSYNCQAIKLAKLSIGLQKTSGTLDLAWLAIHDKSKTKYFKSLASSTKQQPQSSEPMIKFNPYNPYIFLKTFEDFEETLSMRWTHGGYKLNFTKRGEFKKAFVRQAYDSERGNIGEVVCPQTEGLVGNRELNVKLPQDPRIGMFSFWVKHVSGKQEITLSIWSASAKQHYRVKVPLTKRWQKVEYKLSDLKSTSGKSNDILTPDKLNNFQFIADKNEVVFLVDDIIFKGNSNQNGHALFISRPTDNIWTFANNRTIILNYDISSTKSTKVTVAVTIKLPGGKKRQKTFTRKIRAGRNKVKLNIGKLPNGFYNAQIELKKHKIEDNIDDSFVVCDPHVRGSVDTPIGVNIKTDSMSLGSYKSLANAGIGYLRIWDFTWDSIEPVQGKFNYSSQDFIVNWAKQADIKLLPIVQNSASWVSNPPTGAKPWNGHTIGRLAFDNMAAWEKFIANMVNRYKSTITHWEIWNEPDWHKPPMRFFWGTSAQYFEVLKHAYIAAKKADPKCLILSGGISMNPQFTDQKFTRKMIDGGYAKYFDIFAFHGYHGYDKAREAIDIVLSNSDGANKGLWQTEVGTKGEMGTTAAKARSIKKFVRNCFPFLLGDVKHYSFFVVSHDSYIHSLLHRNYAPTAKLAVICNLARILNGMKNLQLEEYNGVQGYSFKRRNGYGVALFGPGKITIIDNLAPVIKIDALGFESQLNLSKNQKIDCSDAVIYLISSKPISLK